MNASRKKEDEATNTKRKKEDLEWGSWFKNTLWRDYERNKEDTDKKTKRNQEDTDLTAKKEKEKNSRKVTLAFKTERAKEEVKQIHTTCLAIDHLLINHEFKTVMSKLVDIESYQRMYHSLALGTIDIESLQRVQKSLTRDIKFSAEELKLLKNHSDDLNKITEHIASLFDTNNSIYQTIEDTLKKQVPPLTIDNIQPALKTSIEELQKIDFDMFGKLNRQKAWYAIKEAAIATLATPFIVATSAIYAGKTVGLWGGFLAGAISGAAGAGVGGVPGAIGGAIAGEIVGAGTGGLVGLYIGVIAAPLVGAVRFYEAFTEHQYTINRRGKKYQASFEQSKKDLLSPSSMWNNLVPDDYFKHEKKFLGGIRDTLNGKLLTAERRKQQKYKVSK